MFQMYQQIMMQSSILDSNLLEVKFFCGENNSKIIPPVITIFMAGTSGTNHSQVGRWVRNPAPVDGKHPMICGFKKIWCRISSMHPMV